jgi:stage II sporulation protein E
MLTATSKRLSEKGIAAPRDIPEYMKSRCGALPGIIGEINSECAELYRNARLSDKTEVFAMEYKSVAALLSEICSENQKELALDEELSAKLGEALAEIGFGEGGVSVYGDRRKRIVARGFDVSRGSVGSAELKKRVEKACGFPVSDPIIELSENIMTLRMGSARRFSAKSVCLTSGAELDFCGDAVATFENCDDRYFALISDGMGSGEEASVTSAVCSVFLQKMLGAGNGEYASVKMLNSFIRAKRGECSSTVDLAGIDLLTGRMTFTKCGAAVSLVKRGNELFRMSAGTLPLGILDGIDAGKLSFDGEAGDVLIMMSDGVSSGEDDMGWLVEMLTDEWEDDLDAMAKKTVDRAREKGRNDDVSVIFTEIRAL